MCVVNVKKNVANPMIATGNGFTIILKADGTVWSIGNNANGSLGNGNTENKGIPQRVKRDEDTYLENVIKIAVRFKSCTSTYKRWICFCLGVKRKRTMSAQEILRTYVMLKQF